MNRRPPLEYGWFAGVIGLCLCGLWLIIVWFAKLVSWTVVGHFALAFLLVCAAITLVLMMFFTVREFMGNYIDDSL